MINFLNQLENPQFNHVAFFEVMRDFRKGGLKPDNFIEFMQMVESLPPINERTEQDYDKFHGLGLVDVTQADFPSIMREVIKRTVEKSKKCWHPLASSATCKVDGSGNIIVSAAHSIQNNGVLSQIADGGIVVTYAIDVGEFQAKKLHKNAASIFWGFCNTHDAIFNPIEVAPYTQTKEQNFLFAYRAFIVGAHKKLEVSNLIHFGAQADNDTRQTKKIFDAAILANNFDCVETEIIELPAFYPIAVSGCFYIDFDFQGNPIPHSDDRMEYIYVTLLPSVNKTYFILSYLKNDKHLYGQLGKQLIQRNNLRSDISILLAAHVENIYYDPKYYETFIEPQEKILGEVSFEAQIDFATVDENDERKDVKSITPPNYLDNPYGVSLFGY
jgi:hypothetical protein